MDDIDDYTTWLKEGKVPAKDVNVAYLVNKVFHDAEATNPDCLKEGLLLLESRHVKAIRDFLAAYHYRLDNELGIRL